MDKTVYSKVFSYTHPLTNNHFYTSVKIVSRQAFLSRKEQFFLTIDGNDPGGMRYYTKGRELPVSSVESSYNDIFPIWARDCFYNSGQYKIIDKYFSPQYAIGSDPLIDYFVMGVHDLSHFTGIKSFDGHSSFEMELNGWSGGGAGKETTESRRRHPEIEAFLRWALPAFDPNLEYKVHLSDKRLWIDSPNKPGILWSHTQDMTSLFYILVKRLF